MKTTWKDKNIDPLQEYNAESHRITVESIQRALANLLVIKKYNEITIKEIVSKAGVSRSAFYRNYQSKEEVLQSIIYDSFKELTSGIEHMNVGSQDDWQKMMEKMVLKCADLYSIMTSDAWQGSTMLQCMNYYFAQMYPLKENGDKLYPRFVMGGVYNCIQYWLDSGMKETPAQISERIMNCIWKQ